MLVLLILEFGGLVCHFERWAHFQPLSHTCVCENPEWPGLRVILQESLLMSHPQERHRHPLTPGSRSQESCRFFSPYTHTHIYIYSHMYIYIDTHMDVCIIVCIYIHTHTQSQTLGFCKLLWKLFCILTFLLCVFCQNLDIMNILVSTYYSNQEDMLNLECL